MPLGFCNTFFKIYYDASVTNNCSCLDTNTICEASTTPYIYSGGGKLTHTRIQAVQKLKAQAVNTV